MSLISQIGDVLSKIDPVEYTVAAAALATFFHSRLKKVWDLSKNLNVTISMFLPLILGALKAAPESATLLNYLHNLVVSGSPIYLIGQALYYGWTRKWEQLDALTTPKPSTAPSAASMLLANQAAPVVRDAVPTGSVASSDQNF